MSHTGERISIRNKKTGKIIDNVLDVPDYLLATTMHILNSKIMSRRWLYYFLQPFNEEDLTNKRLMNNRRKAAYFMSEQLRYGGYDFNHRDVSLMDFYIQRLIDAYQLLQYSDSLQTERALMCTISDKEMKEITDLWHGPRGKSN